MAIRAAAIEVADGIEQGWSRGVAAGVMAGVAHPGHAHLQQLRIVGAVRFMAVDTVLHHRRMLPKEWTTPLGVAGEAILIDRALLELAGIGGAVWVVATGAGHLPFAVRHMRGALQLGAAHLVTVQAEFGLHLLQASVGAEWRKETGFLR